MKMVLLEIIKRIRQRKKDNNIEPCHVTLKEIKHEILSMTEDELSNMVNKGTLKTGPAGANSEYFKINAE